MHEKAYKNSIYKHTLPFNQRFPEEIDYIIKSLHHDSGSLFVSNIQAAQNPAILQRFKIRAVLSCAKGYKLNHPKSIVPHYTYIPAIDHESCNIYGYFEEATNFIAQHLAVTNVLVHCVAGVSRSVSIVIAYLIRWHSMSDLEAYNLVNSRKKIINPNKGFLEQLKRYHSQMSSKSYKTPLKKKEQQAKKTASTSNRQKKEDSELLQKYKLDNKTKQLDENKMLSIKSQKNYNQDYIQKYNNRHQKSFEERYMQRYYSPLKTEELFDSNNKYRKTNTSFFNLSQNLEQRIARIKQKYQSHRKILSTKLSKRGDNFLDKGSDFQNIRDKKERLQSNIEYPKNTRYLNKHQNEQQLKKQKIAKNEGRIVRSLTTQNTQKYKKDIQPKPSNGIYRSPSTINKNKSLSSSIDNSVFLNSNLYKQKSTKNVKNKATTQFFVTQMTYSPNGQRRQF